MDSILAKPPQTNTLALAGETIARFVEPSGLHPVCEFLGSSGPPVWLCGATANVAANAKQLHPWLNVRFVSEVARDTFGLATLKLARLYGLDTSQLRVRDSGLGGSTITPLYRMPLAASPDLPQVAEMFTRAHGPIPHFWTTETIRAENILDGAGVFFADGIFASLGNLRNDTIGTTAIALRCFELARERGIVTVFDTNRRASLWANKPEIRYTAEMYDAFFRRASVISGSVGLLLPMVDRLPDFEQNDFGRRCIAEMRDGGEPALLRALLAQVLAKYDNIEAIGVTLRDELSPGLHTIACAVLTKDGRFAVSPLRTLTIVDRPGMGDAAAAVLIGACFEAFVVLQQVANRMAAAFAFAGLTVGDIPPHRDLAYLDHFLPSSTVRQIVR